MFSSISSKLDGWMDDVNQLINIPISIAVDRQYTPCYAHQKERKQPKVLESYIANAYHACISTTSQALDVVNHPYIDLHTSPKTESCSTSPD